MWQQPQNRSEPLVTSTSCSQLTATSPYSNCESGHRKERHRSEAGVRPVSGAETSHMSCPATWDGIFWNSRASAPMYGLSGSSSGPCSPSGCVLSTLRRGQSCCVSAHRPFVQKSPGLATLAVLPGCAPPTPHGLAGPAASPGLWACPLPLSEAKRTNTLHWASPGPRCPGCCSTGR